MNIERLKLLEQAYTIAEEYDYIPGLCTTESAEIQKCFAIPKETAEKIMTDYSGLSAREVYTEIRFEIRQG